MTGMDVEDRLRSELAAEAARVRVPADMAARVEAATARASDHSGRRVATRAVVGVAAATALVVGGVVALGGGTGEPQPEVAVALSTTGDPASGMWADIAPAPVTPRFQHGAVWTGSEVVVLGGYDEAGEPIGDAGAFDPAQGTWRTIADPPGEVAGSPVAVWTGSEVVAFGGVGDGGDATQGAAYDPAADSWRDIADAELGALTSSGSYVAWTGDAVLVAGFFRSQDAEAGDGGIGGTQGAALYDPAADTWTELPDAPGPLPTFADAVWTGTELLVIGPEEGSGLAAPDAWLAYALDPATGAWRTLPPPPGPVRGSAVVSWTGSELVVAGGEPLTGGDEPPLADGAAYDPAADAWRELPAAPVGFTGDERYAEPALGGRVVAFRTDGPERRTLILDPATSTWTEGPESLGATIPTESPDERPERQDAPTVATDDQLVVWGGGAASSEGEGVVGCCRPTAVGAVFTPPAG
jgi:N-acetylneuraminic acid mutarotase